MKQAPRLLVADMAFASSRYFGDGALLNVFPMKKGDGAYRAKLDQLVKRSKAQSEFLDCILPRIAPAFWGLVPAFDSQATLVVRPFLAAVTSAFIDRYLRVAFRLEQQNDVLALEVEPYRDVRWTSEFLNGLGTSWHLNQEIIGRIAVGLGHGKIMTIPKEEYPEYPDQLSAKNLLFMPSRDRWSNLQQRVLRRIQSLLHALPNRQARLLSTGFVYDEHYIVCSGLYGPRGALRRCRSVPVLMPGIRSPGLRRDLRDRAGPLARPPMLAYLKEVDPHISSTSAESLFEVWLSMLIDWYPTAILEGLADNMEIVQRNLDLSQVNAIVGSDLTSDVGLLQCLAARQARKKIIGMQHSTGSYGYIEDMSAVAELEYPLYDILITLGWNKVEDHFPKPEIISLPSPKLSSRPLASDYCVPEICRNSSKRDVLLLSNLFHRFPAFSTCGQSRVDFLDEIFDSQRDLVQTLTSSGLTIDHKPYNEKYIGLYPEYFESLQLVGGQRYRVVDVSQKGLSVDLIKSCRIVLWDQIGSGAIECLSTGIPTIVFWQRIYSREVRWAKDLIAMLEQCGIVHAHPDTLAVEIKNYLSDPRGWMTDTRRVRAIEAFCRQFAWTEPDWRKYWADQLRQWPLPSLRSSGPDSRKEKLTDASR
jgi:hypothetical protein